MQIAVNRDGTRKIIGLELPLCHVKPETIICKSYEVQEIIIYVVYVCVCVIISFHRKGFS